MASENFKEFEHKYLVEEGFDEEAFFARLRSLGNPVEKHLDVRDTYYTLPEKPAYIFRHRHDEEIQQFTVKSFGGDTRERMEVNLNLLNPGSQKQAVARFLEVFGEVNVFEINKRVDIFDFPDCEIVHYRAYSKGRTVRCVEFEAVGVGTLEQAEAVIFRYAHETGFAGQIRCRESLFELLSTETTIP